MLSCRRATRRMSLLKTPYQYCYVCRVVFGGDADLGFDYWDEHEVSGM